MEQVTAKRRIKVATRDHAIISMLHLRLHRVHLLAILVFLGIVGVAALVFLGIVGVAAFIAAGVAQPNVESEWVVTSWEKGKRLKIDDYIVFDLELFGIFIRVTKASGLEVGDHIVLRDDGWFDLGNNFIRVTHYVKGG